MLKKLFTAAALALAVLSFPAAAAEEKAGPIPIGEIRDFANIYGAIKSYYVDETKDGQLFEDALAGLVSGLDPHSSYLNKEDFEDLSETTKGEFGGVGMEVSMDAGGVLVISPIDDTPAQKAGVHAGDVIIKIDGEATVGLTLNENVKRLRGKPGTQVKITIARKDSDQPVNLTLTRAIIKAESVKTKRLKSDYFYARVSQFQERTANDLARALTAEMKKAPLKGVILDLRNNPGGLLTSAVGVSAVFLPPGTDVVSTRGRGGKITMELKTRPRDYATEDSGKDFVALVPKEAKKLPMAVLINAASASASEIVSGALQDQKRAVIMGRRSFGKGSVQTIIPLKNSEDRKVETGIKITTARYYTPSGRTIQARGITPDVELWDTPEGNFIAFDIREEDLAGHLIAENTGRAAKEGAAKEKPKAAAAPEVRDKQPMTRYSFGDEKDFPLAEAVRYLNGEKLLTGAKKPAAK